MGYGNEIVLGLAWKDWHRIPVQLPEGLKIETNVSPRGFAIEMHEYYNDEQGDISNRIEAAFVKYDVPLRNAHKKCLQQVGVTNIRDKGSYINGKIDGIAQRIDFIPFSVNLFYDPFEMGDEPESSLLGVSVGSSYWRRIFVDLDGMSPIVMNAAFMAKLAIAKREITAVCPWLYRASWSVVECHY